MRRSSRTRSLKPAVRSASQYPAKDALGHGESGTAMSLYYTMLIPRLIIVCRSYEFHIGLLLDKST